MELKLKTGAVIIPVRDEYGELIGNIKIAPTDTDIYKRLLEVQEDFEKIEFPKDATAEDEIKFTTELSQYIRDKFDYLFNAPVSEILFKVSAPLTVVDNDGTYACMYVLEEFQKIFDEIFKERSASAARIAEATAGYDTPSNNN